jgi:hypothetical protein
MFFLPREAQQDISSAKTFLLSIEHTRNRQFGILIALYVFAFVGTIFSIRSWPDSLLYLQATYVCVGVYIVVFVAWRQGILSRGASARTISIAHCAYMIVGSGLCGQENSQFALLNYYALPAIVLMNMTIVSISWSVGLFALVAGTVVLYGQKNFMLLLLPSEPLLCFECLQRESYFLPLSVSLGCIIMFGIHRNNVEKLNLLLKESYECNGECGWLMLRFVLTFLCCIRNFLTKNVFDSEAPK